MFKGKVLLFSLVLLFATSLYAGDVDECKSTAGTSCALRVSCCPQGDFEFVREGCGGDADYIWVEIHDASDIGIAGIPWTDYWMGACVPHPEYLLCFCPGGIIADSLTNEDGRTTFSGRLAGGGCVLSGGLWISCQGKILVEPGPCTEPVCIDLVIVSVDINGTCKVELGDLSFFSDSYNQNEGDPDYDDCADWNDDNKVNLSDFSFLGEHYDHECF